MRKGLGAVSHGLVTIRLLSGNAPDMRDELLNLPLASDSLGQPESRRVGTTRACSLPRIAIAAECRYPFGLRIPIETHAQIVTPKCRKSVSAAHPAQAQIWC